MISTKHALMNNTCQHICGISFYATWIMILVYIYKHIMMLPENQNMYWLCPSPRQGKTVVKQANNDAKGHGKVKIFKSPGQLSVRSYQGGTEEYNTCFQP